MAKKRTPPETPVYKLSLEEQLARMTAQRDALAKLVDEIIGSDSMEDIVDKELYDAIQQAFKDIYYTLDAADRAIKKRAEGAVDVNKNVLKKLHSITGNTYATEGRNIFTGDVDDDWGKDKE